MALPNVSFTNNLGTIEFQRCLIGITDQHQWNGRQVRSVKQIMIDGFVDASNPDELLDGVLTDPGSVGNDQGQPGILVLPWTTMNTIDIVDIEFPEGICKDLIQVRVTFSDPYPDNNKYCLSFFGCTLHNPRFSWPSPNQPLKDEYPLMPWVPFGMYPEFINNIYGGVMRTKGGFSSMEMNLSGSIVLDNGCLPNDWFDLFQQRQGSGPNGIPALLGTPAAGQPRAFRLSEAVPELANDLSLSCIIITGSTLSWDVENELADLQVQLLCPPQRQGVL